MAIKVISSPVHLISDLSGTCLAIVEHAPMPMALVEGPDQILRQANFPFCRLMANRALPPIGKSFCAVAGLPEQHALMEVLDRVYRTGKPESHHEEQPFERPTVHWTYTMWPVMGEEHPLGVMIQVTETAGLQKQTVAINEALVIGSVHQHELAENARSLNTKLKAEISERKLIEAALRRSEERYRGLFDSIDEGFCVVEMLFDGHGQPTDYLYLEANPAFEKQSGLSEVKGKRMRELIPAHEAHWFKAYGKVALTGEPVRFENEAKGLKRWFDVYAFRLGDQDSRKIAVLLTDITARRRSEAALKNSAKALRESREEIRQHARILEHLVAARTVQLNNTNKQLEALVYSIAHDLRAPLRSMQGYATLLCGDAGTVLSDSSRDFVQRIDQSTQFMDALLSDLLAFSQISQEPMPLTAVNLETVVGSVLSRLQKEIQDMNACVECSGPWPVVLAHESTLSKVLFNLTSNALKFLRPGVSPLLRLGAEEKTGFIRVWVEDNGVGIEPDYHEQIFRLFIRLQRGKYPGTGAGLAMVQKGVERMGGRVGVESTPGQGSRFWIELAKPAAEAALFREGETAPC